MSEEIFPSFPETAESERRFFPWATFLLIGSTVAVFLAQYVAYLCWGEDVIGNALAFSATAWDEHRYWTLLTYAWAHAVFIPGLPGLFWIHVVFNMVFLYCLGPALEDFLGSRRFFFLYLGGAVAASLFWFVCNTDAGASIEGASGAVFAIVAGAGTAAPREEVMVFLFFVLPIRMSLRMMALVVCGLELAQLVFGWMPGVAHSAHLGGAIFGFLYVLAVRWFHRWRYLPD